MTELAKLQDRLLNGVIDMATYEKLKADLLRATQQPQEAVLLDETENHAQRISPTACWVKGVVVLTRGEGRRTLTSSLKFTWTTNYLDREIRLKE